MSEPSDPIADAIRKQRYDQATHDLPGYTLLVAGYSCRRRSRRRWHSPGSGSRR
jgi:hypothetical protein